MDEGGLTLHNGQRSALATISLHDPIVTRGDGCFEAARCYAGVMIGLDDHLERLERSAERMEIRLPSRDTIRDWVVEVAKARGDGVVRVFVSADGGGANVYVFSIPVPIINPLQRLLPVIAPWHPAGEAWELSGVKTLSYAPNMGATRTASHAGFDDALLVSTTGIILEAPTAGVLWVVDGAVETSTVDLGILASVTTRLALDWVRAEGWEVREDRFPLERLQFASEVAIMSTTREILPVVAVGDLGFDSGPVTEMLQSAYSQAISTALAAD